MRKGGWCNSVLKTGAITNEKILCQFPGKHSVVQYIGIAADEPQRIARHINKKNKILPLVQIGWDEDLCGLEATYLDMLSPTYDTQSRDGCWFCHSQSIDQLKTLRNNYPDLWKLLLKWDFDSPVIFDAHGHTVLDFEKRFSMEETGLVPTGHKFKWRMLDETQQ